MYIYSIVDFQTRIHMHRLFFGVRHRGCTRRGLVRVSCYSRSLLVYSAQITDLTREVSYFCLLKVIFNPILQFIVNFLNILPCLTVYFYRKSPSKAMGNPVYQLEGRVSQQIPDTAQPSSADYAEVNDETVRYL